MLKLIKDLWLKRRDIVSDGFDQSLAYISKIIPLKIHKVSSGTECWTWIIPEKWSVENAYIEDLSGNRLLDLKNHPLHVVSYSLPINKVVTREKLLKHLHSNPNRPNAIPFEFKYYQRDWGFCIQYNRLKEFTKPHYRVVINSSFKKGQLKIGEYVVRGKTDEAIAIVAHLDHPGMVNDDLSGVSVLVELAKALKKRKNYYTYKFLLLPETIGSIAYLSQNEKEISKIKYSVFLEMLGNHNPLSLQLSRQGDTEVDRVFRAVLKKKVPNFKEGAFRKIVRNDEMIFNGPGINIPMVSISRSAGEPNHYPEYHTSDDNPKIISEKNLKDSVDLILEALSILDQNYKPLRKFKGPVFLSRYGLWVDWRKNLKLNQAIEQIMLNLEGDKSVLDIAEALGLDFSEAKSYLDKFAGKKLIEKNR